MIVYYEIVSPFIYRIVSESNKPKSFDYIIVGDCQTISELEAPYNEENTEEILKIEKQDNDTDIF